MTTAKITPLQTRRADRIASALGAACILVAVAAAVVLVVSEAFPPASKQVAITCCQWENVASASVSAADTDAAATQLL